MSFETIKVYRQFPIINGFVQLPNNREADKTKHSVETVLSAVSGAALVRLNPDTMPNTGSKFGTQEFIEIEGLNGSNYDNLPS